MKPIAVALLCSLLMFTTSCSDTPSKTEKAEKAEPAKPPEPVTGRYALYQMYTAGRGWSPDIEPFKLNSIHLEEVKAEPGKAAAWQVTFVSKRLNKARSYTYSVVEGAGNLHQGVFAGLDENYPSSSRNRSFPMAAVKTDSDAVYKTALKKGAEYDKKNPGKRISFVLEGNSQFPNVSWRVIWGESVGTSNFSVFVDASTGEYLQTMR